MQIRKWFIIIYGLIILLIIITVLLIVELFNNYLKSNSAREAEYKFNNLAEELRKSSNDLTRYARIYVMTGDTIWENKYWEVLEIRNGKKTRYDGRKIALHDSMKTIGLTNTEYNKLKEAEQKSNNLVYTEKVAFNAMKGFFDDGKGNFIKKATPDTAFARKILFDKKYHKSKLLIMRPIDDFISLVKARTAKNVTCVNKTIYNLIIAIISLMLLTFIFSIIAYIIFYKKINSYIKLLKKSKKELLEQQNLFMKGKVVIFKWQNKKDWPVEYVSHNVSELLLYTEDDFVSGKVKYPDIINKTDKGKLISNYIEAIKNKDDFFNNKPYRITTKEGKEIWVNVFIQIIKNTKGKVTHFFGYLIDVTEQIKSKEKIEEQNEELKVSEEKLIRNIDELKKIRRKLSALNAEYVMQNNNIKLKNRALKIAEKKAQEATKLKSEFLANMSHEIRTPMNSILGFAELIHASVKDKRHQSFVEKIMISGKILLNLINEILDLSKIEAGQLEITKKPTNLYDTIYKISDIFFELSRKKKIPINVIIHNSVPNIIFTDGNRLNQILLNLVGNSLKFTEDGEIKIIVSAKNNANKKNADIIIKIKDTGIGIPENQLSTIFESFRQVEGTKNRKFEGTGLGLSITKKLVKLLGGEINVKSKVGLGSVFTIVLYNVEVIDDIIEKPIISNKKHNNIEINKKENEKIKILHVEDNDMNREIISLFIEDFDYELVEAVNGEQALEVLKKFKPDIILMDIQLPILNGYEATKIIKNNDKLKNIPIIALTANATTGDMKKYKDIFDEYITKPISKSDFVSVLSKFIK